MIMAAEARRRGLDQLPEMRTLLNFSALQLLGSRLVREINGSALPVSSEEVEQYFHAHERDYREVVLSRIFVPVAVKGEGKAAERAEQARTRVTAERISRFCSVRSRRHRRTSGWDQCLAGRFRKRTARFAISSQMKYRTF